MISILKKAFVALSKPSNWKYALLFILLRSFKIPDTEGFGKFDIFASAFYLFTELVRLFYKKKVPNLWV